MITAQDIHEKTFEKAKLGGYDMASVDDFLEELADEVAAAQKENAVLKSKMKVLVDKIEEYRANEEALNSVLMSAQKLAVQIETEARQRSAAMIADADRQVKARIGAIEEEAEIQEKRLAAAKEATAAFVANVKDICLGQISKVDAIASGLDLPEVEDAPAAEDAARAPAEPQLKLDLGGGAPITSKGFDSTQPFSL